MRRRAGVGAVQKQKLEQEKYREKGTEIQERGLEEMGKQVEALRANLEEFASRHRKEIKKNSVFRRQFQEMCASIGVDPLASGKGFWSVLNLGDFYYELSVQIVEVCLATSEVNGGLIGLEELRERVVRSRGRKKEQQEVTTDDLLRAARKLKSLGGGLSVVAVGGGKYVVSSVPGELSMDQTTVLTLAASAPAPASTSVSVPLLREKLGWEEGRAERALDAMLKEGLLWIDLPPSAPSAPLYWFPALFTATPPPPPPLQEP